MMRKVYESDEKIVMSDGDIEKVVYKKDPAFIEGVKNRDGIQPYGPTEKEFFDKYKHLKKVSGGKIINKAEESDRQKTRDYEIDQYERKQRDRMKTGNEKYKKYY